MIEGFRPNAIQLHALRVLDLYRLLTAEQLVRVGTSASIDVVRQEMAVLLRARWVAATPPDLVSGVRRLPRLYWLTFKGAELLRELYGLPAHGARRRMGDTGEILHRIAIMETHISLRAWAAAERIAVDAFVAEFEPGGARIGKATTIPFPEGGLLGTSFTPDARARLTPSDGRTANFVFEVARGGRTHEISSLRAALPLWQAITDRQKVDQLFPGVGRAMRFCILVYDADMLRRVLKGWPAGDPEVWAQFFIKPLSELATFGDDWTQPDGTRRNLL